MVLTVILGSYGSVRLQRLLRRVHTEEADGAAAGGELPLADARRGAVPFEPLQRLRHTQHQRGLVPQSHSVNLDVLGHLLLQGLWVGGGRRDR